MASFRLSRSARADISHILETSNERWGSESSRRYAAILTLAMRTVAAEPKGLTTRDRGNLLTGIRSFHIRHARTRGPEAMVARPVHVLYYRVVGPGLVEILRVLHERMEPSRHLDPFR